MPTGGETRASVAALVRAAQLIERCLCVGRGSCKMVALFVLGATLLSELLAPNQARAWPADKGLQETSEFLSKGNIRADKNGENSTHYFINIPAQRLSESLNILAKQTGNQFLFSYNLAKTAEAKAVVGHYTLTQAIKQLFEGTGLVGHLEEGVLTISQPDLSKQPTVHETTRKQKMSPSKNILSAVLSVLVGAFSGTSAEAEENDNAANQIEEVKVTARKREENIQDVPISITAFGAQDIENLGLKNLQDIGGSVPNVQWDKLTELSNSISIRGVLSSDETIGFEPGVAVIIDDVFVGRAASFGTTLLDVDRIEVLRGPQGTLQGQNVIGGVFNLTTLKPSQELNGKASVSYGNYDALDVRGMISGPVVKDTIAAKLAFAVKDRDGYGRNVHLNKDLDNAEGEGIRGQLLFTPRSNFEALFTLEYQHDEYNPFNSDAGASGLSSPPAELSDRKSTRDFLNFTEKEVSAASGRFNYELVNGMVFTSVTAWRAYEVTQLQDVDEDINVGIGLAGTPLVITAEFEQDQSQFSQEFRLTSPAGSELDWLLGAYYFKEDIDQILPIVFGFNNGTVIDGVANIADSATQTDSYALFGSFTYVLDEHWRITGGLRYTDNQRSIHVIETLGFDGILDDPQNSIFGGPFINMLTADNPAPSSYAGGFVVGDTRRSITDREWTGDMTLFYQWNEDVSTYVKYARGFKGGGFNSEYNEGFSGTTVEPEFVDSFEIGLRSYLFDRRMRFNVTGFYMEHTDQQITLFDALCNCSTTANEDETESKGLELDLLAYINEHLQLSLGVGLIDAEFTAGQNKGNEPPVTPPVSASATIDFSYPLSDDMEFFFFNETNYRDTYYASQLNLEFEEQDYLMVNARAGIRSTNGKWSAGVYGRNLLDEDIFSFLADFPPVVSVGWMAPPRTYGFELLYEF